MIKTASNVKINKYPKSTNTTTKETTNLKNPKQENTNRKH